MAWHSGLNFPLSRPCHNAWLRFARRIESTRALYERIGSHLTLTVRSEALCSIGPGSAGRRKRAYMLACIPSATLHGVDGKSVSVELHVSNELPKLWLHGLPQYPDQASKVGRARGYLQWPGPIYLGRNRVRVSAVRSDDDGIPRHRHRRAKLA